MRGAECSTDHSLIVSEVSWKVRPKTRRRQISTKKLYVAALQDCGKREDFQARVSAALEENHDRQIQTEGDIETHWKRFADTIKEIAQDTIGLRTRKHRDWFDENDTDSRTVEQEKLLTMLQ